MRTHEIHGETFAVVETMPAWALMKLAKSQRSGDAMTELAGQYDFLLALVAPEDHQRLDSHLTALGLDHAGLDAVVAGVMGAFTAHPTERPSSSPSGSPTTGQSSRVVSLSPATEATSKGGQPVAS